MRLSKSKIRIITWIIIGTMAIGGLSGLIIGIV